MKELKDSEIKTSPPKKPLIFYYLAALIVLMLLNVFLFPSLLERQVVEVPYSQFLTMVDGGQVEQAAHRLRLTAGGAAPGVVDGLGEALGLVPARR